MLGKQEVFQYINNNFEKYCKKFLSLKHPQVFKVQDYQVSFLNGSLNEIHVRGNIKSKDNKEVFWTVALDNFRDWVERYILYGIFPEQKIDDIFKLDVEAKIPTLKINNREIVNYNRWKDVVMLRILYLIHIALKHIEQEITQSAAIEAHGTTEGFPIIQVKVFRIDKEFNSSWVEDYMLVNFY